MEEKKIKAKNIASIEDKTVHKILCLCKNDIKLKNGRKENKGKKYSQY